MSKTAVFSTGGHQYCACEGDILKLQKLDIEAGKNVTFDTVLSLQDNDNTTVGAPSVKGASVVCEVLEQKRDKKIVVFKKKRRQNYRRKAGHKQHLTVVRVTEIKAA